MPNGGVLGRIKPSQTDWKKLQNHYDDENIVVRRAEKTAIYEVLNTNDYLDEVGQVLSDEAKFERVTRYPSADLQKKVNAIITAANSQIDGVHFSKIISEYKSGYLYGNVKTHR